MLVDTPFKGAIFALLVYILTLVISLFIAGIIYILFRVIHKEKKKEAAPGQQVK